MPVTATPQADTVGCPPTPEPTAVTTAVSCSVAGLLQSRRERDGVTGTAIPERRETIEIPGRQTATLTLSLTNAQNQPIDLTDCLCTPDGSLSLQSDSSDCPCAFAIRFRLREVATGPCRDSADLAVSLANAAEGQVQITLSAADTAVPGVYLGELALVACEEGSDPPEETVLVSKTWYIAIGASLWSPSQTGPPSLAEIRLHLRDSSAVESRLLETVRFSDSEIVSAIRLPVDYWNEIPPPVARYTTSSFPFRYHWILGTTGYLFRLAAEQHRANRFDYSAGGVSVQDQNQEQAYERASEQRLSEYYAFVRSKKAEISMRQGHGSVGSPYGLCGG